MSNTNTIVKTAIKKYCKDMKLKFHKMDGNGFLASTLTPIKAGMKVNMENGNITEYAIKTIGKKRVFWNMCFDVYNDGHVDIYFGQQR